MYEACATKWSNAPVWIHGDFAIGNILIKDNKLSGVIDFGGTAMGDPACDLVIAWTYLSCKARDIFVPGENERGPLMSVKSKPTGDELFGAMAGFAHMLGSRGNNLIIDEVLFNDQQLKSYVDKLADHTVYFNFHRK